jgi:hemolysin activation/secretion protein
VRAYLPKQDITEGTVTIQVVEAVFGGASIEGAPSRIKPERLLGAIDAAQAKGQSLNAEKLDRALLLLDDLPGVAVAGSLQKGTGENETNLILKTADEPLISGEVNADNAGTRSTGSNRVSGNLYLNSPFGIGDQATANLIHARGNDYVRLAYTAPVGNNGWRIGGSGSYLEYDLVKGDFAGQANGDSSTIGIDATYPIMRSRLKNLYLGLNADHKSFDNAFNHATSTRYDINNFSLSLNGNLFDRLGGGGANAAGFTLSQGHVNLDDQDNRKLLANNVSGSFTKLNYHLSRQQVITDSISAYAALSGQAASDNLDSAEKFYLGGAYGVRAYPTNEGGGDEGQLLNLELRARLPYHFNVTGFYDLGHIRINHDNPVGAGDNSATYKGAGLSAAWTADFGLNLKATWAHRIGDNPNPTATGNDQDGTLKEDRIWLSAMMPF